MQASATASASADQFSVPQNPMADAMINLDQSVHNFFENVSKMGKSMPNSNLKTVPAQ